MERLGRDVLSTELERFYGQLKSPAGMAAAHTGNSQSVPAAQNGKQVSDNSEHSGTLAADFPTVIAVVADQVTVVEVPTGKGFVFRFFEKNKKLQKS